MSAREGAADVVIVGAGVVALCTALALARRGVRTELVGTHRPGEASPAAAGMLAPSVEHRAGLAHDFAIHARDAYPSFLAELEEASGVAIPHNRLGILELAFNERDAARAKKELAPTSSWLDGTALGALEPALGHHPGAAFHPRDGAVNTLVLLRALKTRIAASTSIRVVEATVERLELSSTPPVVMLRDGRRLGASTIILAAGAWSPLVEGIPRALPIEPIRGQMLSLAGEPLRHVTYGGKGYVVPRRDGRTYAGTTTEHVAFDASTTDDGLAAIRGTAARIAPQFAELRILNGWAGLRPMTPDGLPIIGRDPACPDLVYACGHSRNGILLAPLTGERVAEIVIDRTEPADVRIFRVARFETSR